MTEQERAIRIRAGLMLVKSVLRDMPSDGLAERDAYFIEALEGAADGAINHFGLLRVEEAVLELVVREKGE